MNTEDQASIIAVDGYRRISEALITGFEACKEEGCPLNDIQKVQLLASAIQAMDGHESMILSGIRLDEGIAEYARQFHESREKAKLWEPLIPDRAS